MMPPCHHAEEGCGRGCWWEPTGWGSGSEPPLGTGHQGAGGSSTKEDRWVAGAQGPLCPHPALEIPEVDLDGQLPFVRPLPHVAVLQDELPHLFQDDYIGVQEEEAAAEARGEHTLMEKFGERRAQPWGFCSRGPRPVPPRPGRCPAVVLSLRKSLVAVLFDQGSEKVLGLHSTRGAEPGWTRWALTSTARCPCLPPVCLDASFGQDCSLTCDDCRNGGTCLPSRDGCDCPEGWTGLICDEGEAAGLGGVSPGTCRQHLGGAPGTGSAWRLPLAMVQGRQASS